MSVDEENNRGTNGRSFSGVEPIAVVGIGMLNPASFE